MRALIVFHFVLPLFLCLFSKSSNVAFGDTKEMAPTISPNSQPYLPLLGPSPMTELINNTVPLLSGLCPLNFSSVESLMRVTATDCWDSFAPYLANVMCCPQLSATWLTLIGQSSRSSGVLSLDPALSDHCLSDFQNILASKGASPMLQKLCLTRPNNPMIAGESCPVVKVNDFEIADDASRLVMACEKVSDDVDNECCEKVCKNAISDAARRLASSGSNDTDTIVIKDCEVVVLRYLAGKLEPRPANAVLRVLLNCEVNQGCPLTFPETESIVEECGPRMRDRLSCCQSVKDYVSKLQEQSFLTNVQAWHCAELLGTKLQKENMTANIYDLCRITIKDFSLQVELQEFGCLLPSSPSDAIYDRSSGISFSCDLNDNIAAPWPSSSLQSISYCNKMTEIPALPKATSDQNGVQVNRISLPLFFFFLAVLELLLWASKLSDSFNFYFQM